MHLYVASRGILHETINWANDLSAQYFSYTYDKPGHVQLAIRPIMLWEIVFPKEHLQEVMRTLWSNQITGECKQPEPDNKILGLSSAVVRKALGAQPIPLITSGQRRIIRNHNVGTFPIGIKEDGLNPNGSERL